MLFDEMRAIQHKFGYLPPEQIQSLSRTLKIPLYRINGVAEIYPEFRLAPPAQAMVEVCTDIACHLRGADALVADLEQRFAKMGDARSKCIRGLAWGSAISHPHLLSTRLFTGT